MLPRATPLALVIRCSPEYIRNWFVLYLSCIWWPGLCTTAASPALYVHCRRAIGLGSGRFCAFGAISSHYMFVCLLYIGAGRAQGILRACIAALLSVPSVSFASWSCMSCSIEYYPGVAYQARAARCCRGALRRPGESIVGSLSSHLAHKLAFITPIAIVVISLSTGIPVTCLSQRLE